MRRLLSQRAATAAVSGELVAQDALPAKHAARGGLQCITVEMKKRSSSRASRTDWKRVRAMKDKDIKFTPDHPELDVRHVVRGIVRRGLKRV